METLLGELKRELPCRGPQISQLFGLFSQKTEARPETVYINGGPSTGKSAVITALLSKLSIHYAVINLIECYTTRILLESLLKKLLKASPTSSKCDNIMDFVETLKKSPEEVAGAVVVIDKAEKFSCMDCNLFASFLKLRELVGLPISVIFLSELVVQKFYARVNVIEPIRVSFPQYCKEELLEILALDCGKAREMLGEQLDFGVDFYKNYVNAFLSVFYRNCRDLSELRYLARTSFPSYVAPILAGENTLEESMALWRRIAPILKDNLQGLYLRISCEDKRDLELPYYAKYLLIAAYIASYNNAKDDKRLFMKYHGKKRKTVHDIKAKNKVSEKLNTQLGPKPFSFDRLLAIFYSIVEDRVGFNNNLLVQVSSLVELQLLASLSESSTLDGAKYKCNVSFDFVQSVAKAVGFNIRKYLSDFSHM